MNREWQVPYPNWIINKSEWIHSKQIEVEQDGSVYIVFKKSVRDLECLDFNHIHKIHGISDALNGEKDTSSLTLLPPQVALKVDIIDFMEWIHQSPDFLELVLIKLTE